MDLAVAVLALLMMAFLMTQHLNFEKERELQASEKTSLQRKAIFLIDAMVKNRNEENPLVGSALLDWGKKRVEQNELDPELFSKAGQLQDEKFFVGGIYLDFGNKKETIFLEKKGGECIGLDRLVSIQGKLAMIGVVVCEKGQQ